MAAFDFPNTPSNGQTYSANGIDWIYDGSVWKKDATAGVKGQKGEIGQKGQKGEIGEKGAKGDKGDKGQKGEIGATGGTGGAGSDGDKGQKGEAGVNATGTKGQKGEKGEIGPQGGTGGTGSPGDKGQKGQEGVAGSTGIPVATIVAYGGNSAPSGWQLCNGGSASTSALQAIVGSNVPDLRNRFIVGAGNGYSVGNTGGADSVTLTVNQMPAHDHDTDLDGYKVFATGPNGLGFIGYGGPGGYPGGYVNMQNTGGGQSHENRPPYYALTYIIKT